MAIKRIDKTFFLSVLVLVLAGFFIFSSAALGILARQGLSFTNVLIKQIVIGAVLGGAALLIAAKVPYSLWRKYAFHFFVISILLTLAVFIPQLGFHHGGAKRWLTFGPLTFQPVEVLKLASVIYFAAWISSVKGKITTVKYGLVPFLIILGVSGFVLLLQPDTGNLLVIGCALLSMFIVAGGKIRHVLAIVLLGAIVITALIFTRPYLRQRLDTFINPAADAQGSGYQIQQSLIAVGNGHVFGRGFGQSIQKFSFLPEPIGDSIFAVAAEEFGFVGASTLILLYIFFGLRGLKIASRAPDLFSGLLACGIAILILAQAFLNMGGMLGVLPLKGIPLTFISQGGTAMLFALAEVGIILNISKGQREK